MFFKDVICYLTDYCMAWFPLVDLSSCEVMGDFNYRHIPPVHIMLYIYATKSDYVNYNLCYKETLSSMINTFLKRWVTPYDEEVRVITGNIFLQRMMRYSNFFLYLFQRKYFELKSLLSFHFTLIQLKQLKERLYPHMILVKCAVTGREVYKKNL